MSTQQIRFIARRYGLGKSHTEVLTALVAKGLYVASLRKAATARTIGRLKDLGLVTVTGAECGVADVRLSPRLRDSLIPGPQASASPSASGDSRERRVA